jgi:hypothetical protein
MILGTQEGEESSLPKRRWPIYLLNRRGGCLADADVVVATNKGLKGERSGRCCCEPEEVKEANEIGSRNQITWSAS